MPSSLSDYRNRVKNEFDSVRATWLAEVRQRIAGSSQGDQENPDVAYWTSLLILVLLARDTNDPDVEKGIKEGLERYQREMKADRNVPPSAAFIVQNKEGAFLLAEMETAAPTPEQLVRKHLELIEGKLTVVQLISRFIQAAYSLPETQGVQRDGPNTIQGQLEELKGDLGALSIRLNTIRVQLTRALDQPSHQESWPQEGALRNNVPQGLSHHVGVEKMEQIILQERETRRRLEKQRDRLLAVASQDDPAPLVEALKAIEGIVTTDPDGKRYKILQEDQPPRPPRRLTLDWEGSDYPLRLPLTNVKEKLEAMRAEQQQLDEWHTALLKRTARLAGPLLDTSLPTRELAAAFWAHQQEEAITSIRENLWRDIVRVPTLELQRWLGSNSQLLLLEQARRNGDFEEGPGSSVPRIARELLSTNGQMYAANTTGKALSPERLRAFVAAIPRLTLAELLAGVQEILDGQEISKVDATDRNTWPPPASRLTLSVYAYNRLAQLVEVQRRLEVVMEWVQDFSRNHGKWRNDMTRYDKQYQGSQPGSAARRTAAEWLTAIAPDYAYDRYRIPQGNDTPPYTTRD